MSKYSYDSTGWLCDVCDDNSIDEYGCQINMKDGDPVCLMCCVCPEHSEENEAGY